MNAIVATVFATLLAVCFNFFVWAYAVAEVPLPSVLFVCEQSKNTLTYPKESILEYFV